MPIPAARRLLILFAFTVITGCAGDHTDAPTVVTDRQTLVVGVDRELPPYSFVDA